jgi:signal transduction histidine kinase
VRKIEGGGIDVADDQVNVAEFLAELKTIYDASQTKALAIVWKCPSECPPIKTDAIKLRLILRNLINNAIKFTEKGKVLITAHFDSNSESVDFTVIDSGPGIPEDAITQIFDKFSQLPVGQCNSATGIGLGLYIVKNLAALIEGKIEVESELNKGSAFKVTLPVQRVAKECRDLCSEFKGNYPFKHSVSNAEQGSA